MILDSKSSSQGTIAWGRKFVFLLAAIQVNGDLAESGAKLVECCEDIPLYSHALLGTGIGYQYT